MKQKAPWEFVTSSWFPDHWKRKDLPGIIVREGVFRYRATEFWTGTRYFWTLRGAKKWLEETNPDKRWLAMIATGKEGKL